MIGRCAQRAGRARCDQHGQHLSFRGVGFARAAAGGAPRPWQCACKASKPRPAKADPNCAEPTSRKRALLAPRSLLPAGATHPVILARSCVVSFRRGGGGQGGPARCTVQAPGIAGAGCPRTTFAEALLHAVIRGHDRGMFTAR
ncbi:hypothetical protein HPB50_013680 [Hyalomma asiaticum]|uniref:Uncharacterized protein n=1 Tax=Hyalomma asiaticum TaxID=266040 RepID=A0ACB7TJH4_HYAAI|nr:hypothetical protein HPB50_013680 [Hyalomma asiaticum]